MASITQTVPNYALGISEQPDQLKFPGQVKDLNNAIPDITKGLFKRPGGKRVGNDPLASVQSGGSWFHYFRDEAEGAYIGQVDINGQVRVWKANGDNAGAPQSIEYGSVTWDSTVEYTSGQRVQSNSSGTIRIYEAQATISSGGSAPTHTSGTTNNWLHVETAEAGVKNYLQTASSENLQFLTINDTTFVSNRDSTRTATAVATTGTTTAYVHPHFGFIELLRTENGRQYGVNINNGTGVTTVTRATKIKITDHNFGESDGTGHCPGIGTEVYAVTAKSSYTASENITHVKNSSGTTLTSGKTNLTFRVTALGQQGVSPNYNASSDGPDGQNYRCSYNIESVLLHGGEGWAVGDVVRVVPEHADEARNNGTQAHVDVTVTEIETAEVNAKYNNTDIGLIRPAPTPFDADTAVTADTIIGGIKSALPSGVTGTIIGTGMYLSSNSAFNVEVVEEDLMRCFQGTVNDVQNLPNQCKHGYIVKIANSRMSDEDDYYLRFVGENGQDGSGSWVECAKPGIVLGFDNATMPLVIQRTGITAAGTASEVATFTVKQFNYENRTVGDDTTNPMPSFVGNRINKVLFFRNRLAFLSGENVILCRPGTLGLPDFFNETSLTVSAADPIDISCASMFPSDLFDGIELNTGLVVFSTNQQFLLSSDDTVLNPDTAKLRSISTFNYNKVIAPISLGTTIGYIDNSNKFSRFNEMANVAREGEPNVVEVSKIVPSLLPKDIDLITNSRENSMVLFGKTGSNTVFGFRYFQVSDKRTQAAWFKWSFKNNLIYHFIIDDEYFYLDENYFLHSVKLIQDDADPSIVENSTDFQINIDNHTDVSGGVFDEVTMLTTFSGVTWLSSVTDAFTNLVVVDTNTNATRVGRYGKPTSTGSTSFTLPGDWSGVTLKIGYIYEYNVKLPRIYPTTQQGESTRSDLNSSLVVHRVKFHFGKIGLYETTLERVGKNDYTEVYESSILDEYDVSDAPYLDEYVKTVPVYEKNMNVDIILKSSHPAPATLRAMSWEGDYSPKYYKRV